jgi:hypothetical protein
MLILWNCVFIPWWKVHSLHTKDDLQHTLYITDKLQQVPISQFIQNGRLVICCNFPTLFIISAFLVAIHKPAHHDHIPTQLATFPKRSEETYNAVYAPFLIIINTKMNCCSLYFPNCIGGVMVSLLASSVVDLGFEPNQRLSNWYLLFLP